ncbi:P-loop containing nucleoside triphosphate hydrolase protein [Mycena rosella]|uniref:P-loop containing nucleoside triphosphate hydrolase protein n=1 Tax=Mycena rosella TaxID=1033263 RepID=A0AAD7DYB3_MYCRO|nr:P-loop containing nucleoside triphosphate hydrolase protein [Mycena rosella]
MDPPQVPLNNFANTSSGYELDSLSIPVFCAALSALIFVVHAALVLKPKRATFDAAVTQDERVTVGPRVTETSTTRLIFKILRLCGCLVLLALAVTSAVIGDQNQQEAAAATFKLSAKMLLCLVYFYASILASISISGCSWSTVSERHVNTLLLAILFTYVYRDVYPLATFARPQLDIDEGGLMWAKIVILTIIGVVLPLAVPRSYTPLDAQDSEPAAGEQTASIISLVTYSFLDPLIFLASQLSHLSYDLLPPLPDYNDVKNLKAAAFTHLTAPSEGKLRHVFFSLLWIFRAEYATVLLLSTVQVAASFSSPIAINRLLNDLETKASDADARPWLWIVLLFVGPTVGSVATQWGRFISNRVNVQAEAILTELIFEHALRVRVKAETSDLDFSEGTGPPAAKARNLVGKLNNLATTDLRNIVTAGEELPKLLAYLLQGCLGVCFLYKVLDWAAFVGLGVTVAMFPLPSLVAQQLRSVQQGLMQRTDARVQTVSETMSLLRMIKLFAWEKKTEERISEARSDELNWLWKNNSLQLFVSALNFIIPIFTMMATYATYSMTVFDMFREQLHQFFFTMTNLITGRVAVDRLDEFLRESELLDAYSAPSQPTDIGASSLPISANYIIGFNNATFSWSSSDATQRHFLLRIDGSLFFKPNCINLIVGPTGAGKTSLLMALLGEMHFIPSSRDSWFNLGQQKVAYAAQQSWVLPDTIKANIVFGASFDSDRYNKVLYQCGLEPDLEMFVAGDLQEIGEGGLTLSGGQKARITLARAVYSSAAILLLDDVLAALDVHTAQWIVEKCFRGDLLIGRTMLLVTHNIALTQPIAEFVVSMGSDGRILSQGTVSDALAKNHDLALVVHGVKTQTLHEEIADGSLEKRQTKGKLVLAEEVALGHLSWDTLKFYMSAQGGGHPIFYFITLGICMLITDSLVSLQTWYLGHFASQYDDNDVSEVDVPYHLAIYGAILFGTVAVYSFNYLRYIIGMIRASTIIHAELVHSILGTTLRQTRFPIFDRLPYILQDVRDVDVTIGMSLWSVLDLFCLAGIKLGIILIMSPLFVLPAAVLLLAGGWVGNLYRKAQLSVKREMSNARAPVLGHFGAAIDGLISIRAYGAQEAFIDVSLKHINYYTRTARTFQLLGRWVGIRLDTLGTVFTGLLAVYMVYFQDHGSSDVGFSLNMSSGFGLLIMYGVGTINQLEIQSNSIERIKQYLEIEQEPKETVNGRPPAHWPSSGNLRAENLSARYSADGPSVLRDISFDIKGGERIGIVGRTGSGKSSLTLALLRAILTDGLVYYDGIATSSLNLEAVRRNITIIPQIPELLNDSLRMNLDPLGENDDATMNDALRAAGLFSLQEASNGEGTQITLDTLVASGGANLSVGQRQILALARALIRGSKVLVLDEATSAIDYETDKVIQESLRTELGKDVTLLTVAHRLQSIMDADRIMVLDAGNIVEFASPQQLLANPAGKLRALVDESQDKDILLAMASKPAFNRR